MRIGITDSGTGGLSVCAGLEARLRAAPVDRDLEIFYLNAALRDDYSYNAMPTRQGKLEAFGRFLDNVAKRYRPDLLYIACNSLSVLFEDSFFAARRDILTRGIVETGTRVMRDALQRDPDLAVIVFATPTTVEEGTYPQRLQAAGIAAGRIVQQACPGLPDAISNDASGGLAERLLREYVPQALGRFGEPPRSVAAFMGCTHYGYQAGVFEHLLRERVDDVRVLNPNTDAADEILALLDCGPGQGRFDVRLVTPYAIPEKPRVALPRYLGEKAPATVAALLAFEHDPGLYGPAGRE